MVDTWAALRAEVQRLVADADHVGLSVAKHVLRRHVGPEKFQLTNRIGSKEGGGPCHVFLVVCSLPLLIASLGN